MNCLLEHNCSLGQKHKALSRQLTANVYIPYMCHTQTVYRMLIGHIVNICVNDTLSDEL